MQEDKKQKQEENKAKDRAGIGQTDEEKGILPEEERAKKREELKEKGDVKERPRFHSNPEEDTNEDKPLKFKQ